MSQMESDVRDFLKRVVWTISASLLYLLINSTAGIMYRLFFFEDKPGLGNYIFYLWFILSTVFLIRLLYTWWKRKFPHG